MTKEKKPFIAVSLIWFERFMECSRCQGSPEFPRAVWKFVHSLVNLGSDKKAIKDRVTDYIEKTWYPHFIEVVNADCENSNVSDMDYDMLSRKLIFDLNEQSQIVNLFEFITQTIQDSGVGWPTQEQFDSYAGGNK